ncbi:MAG: hypothetical protein ACRYGG_23895 [Janthinobacterium lividum]
MDDFRRPEIKLSNQLARRVGEEPELYLCRLWHTNVTLADFVCTARAHGFVVTNRWDGAKCMLALARLH